jgi:uncharacterized protein YdhG (YjbR/CyaY superfamily)
VRYADDFIVTGKSKKILEQKVKPAIEKFLSERGLKLSEEKTCITYIKHGFTFLGQTFRKHGNTLHITPSKEGVQALVREVGNIIRKHVFSFVHKYKKKTRILKVIRVCSIGIKRHIKIKAEANPYLPEFSSYYWRRRNVKEARLLGALSHRQYQARIASR